jgi:hypothetical protein
MTILQNASAAANDGGAPLSEMGKLRQGNFPRPVSHANKMDQPAGGRSQLWSRLR